MNYISSKNQDQGAFDLSNNIVKSLNDGKKVLWFLTGGSSIPACVTALNNIKEHVGSIELKNLTVTLTDERFGPLGHTDSSWQKLSEAGFDFESVNAIPVISDTSFEEAAKKYDEQVRRALSEHNVIVAMFGVGSDMHIAGILPQSAGTEASGYTTAYDTNTFKRITLTLGGIKQVNMAYVFIFGYEKKDVIAKLQTSVAPISLEPSLVLRSIPSVYIYSDQI